MQVLLDEPVALEENELSPLIDEDAEHEEEIGVSKASDAKDRAANRSFLMTVVTVIVSVLAVLLSATSLGYTVYRDHKLGQSIDSKIAGLQSSLRILTAAVAPQLYNAVDSNLRSALTLPAPQAAKALNGVQANLKQLQESNTTPDTLQLNQSAALLADVTAAHPELGEGWAASGQLISYRSPNTSKLHNCFDVPYKQGPYQDPRGNTYVLRLRDCTFVLDDEPAFRKSEAFQDFLSQIPNRPSPLLVLELHNVNVVYNGGKPINVSAIVFINCSFKFNVPSVVPTREGKAVVQGLLTADLTKPVEISFIPGM